MRRSLVLFAAAFLCLGFTTDGLFQTDGYFSVLTGSDPYDLSPYESRINEVMGASNRPSWPTEPTITSTTVINTNDCSALNTALSAANTKVELDAAITSCTWDIDANNVWLEMTDTASITGSCDGDCVDRANAFVKITGGSLTISTGGCLFYAEDTLVKNVVIDCVLGPVQIAGTGSTTWAVRQAWISNTITAEEYAHYNGGEATDLIIANNDFQGSEGGGHANTRYGDITRGIWVDNYFKPPTGSSFQSRWWQDESYILIAGNTWVKDGTPAGQNVWIGNDSGTGQCGTSSNFLFADNTLYYNGSPTSHGIGCTLGSSCGGDSQTITIDGNTTYESPDPVTFVVPANNPSWGSACTVTNSGTINADNTTGTYSSPPTCVTLGCGADH